MKATASVRTYRRLLRLYSAALQREFGDDMVDVFVDMLRAARADNRRFPVVRVWAAALLDIGRTSVPDRLGVMPGDPLRPLPASRRAPMETLLQDFRYAIRTLSRSPGFTVVAAMILALGIAATATIFSIADHLLLDPPPGVRSAGGLVTVHRLGADDSSFHAFPIPWYRELAAAETGLADTAAFSLFDAAVATGAEPWMATGMIVSGNYFSVLGTEPASGRFFAADEDAIPGDRPVVVLSHAIWQTRYGADLDVIGRELRINGHRFTVVGIAEERFGGHLAVLQVGMWVPLASQGLVKGAADLSEEEAGIGLETIARLNYGVALATANQRFDAAGAAMTADRGEADSWHGADMLPYSPIIPMARTGAIGFIAVIAVVAAILLLITSVNVANMLIARAAGRGREIGVRLALGAHRTRIVRQLLTESILLSVFGAVLAGLLTLWATRLLATVALPIPITLNLDFTPDLGVLLGAMAVAIACGTMFGLAPALHATRGQLVDALKDGSVAPLRRRRMRSFLVTAQVAGTVTLLVAAGLLMRGLARAETVDIGFEPQNVTTLAMNLSSNGYGEEEADLFYGELLQRLAAVPGVRSAATVSAVPLSGNNQTSIVIVPGLPLEPGKGLRRVDYANVSPGYFETMGIALVDGREFDIDDRHGGAGVGIINESLAALLWPDGGAVGETIFFGRREDPYDLEVVGVARDAKYRSLADSGRLVLYVSSSQFRDADMTLLVSLSQAEAARAVRAAVIDLAPGLAVGTPIPLTEVIGISLLPNRVIAGLAVGSGGIGLILAAIGLYGLLAYGVAQQTREIGIRMALGASERKVRRMVVRDGLRLTLVGLGVGLLLATGVATLLRGMLFGVSPFDPATFGLIILTLLTTAFVACYLPARRAAAINPLEALRSE